ncbi:hypothetical protein CPB85DRAFT_398052 [Mucidula mucida]|nr:hypothetical protein CPB85DRAFT_398052 [Mucidula mucida]
MTVAHSMLSSRCSGASTSHAIASSKRWTHTSRWSSTSRCSYINVRRVVRAMVASSSTERAVSHKDAPKCGSSRLSLITSNQSSGEFSVFLGRNKNDRLRRSQTLSQPTVHVSECDLASIMLNNVSSMVSADRSNKPLRTRRISSWSRQISSL